MRGFVLFKIFYQRSAYFIVSQDYDFSRAVNKTFKPAFNPGHSFTPGHQQKGDADGGYQESDPRKRHGFHEIDA